MYPRVAEVQEGVAARSEALARRAKPLSRVIPARARAYAMADDAIFTSSQPVNSAFAQLVASRSLGSRRWGSITFSEMERLERLFQGQLEVTSSSLWLMSDILAMLKRDGLQPSSTRPCLQYLQPCLARLELLLPALRLSGPSAGRACWPIPLSQFRRHRSVT